MRNFTSGVLIGLSIIVSGCVSNTEASFASRNAEVELDLHSLVRGQSNDLLSLTQNLETRAAKHFSAPKKLANDLEKTVIHMDQLHLNLPTLLAHQDVELAELRALLAEGAIGKSTLKARAQDIRTYRKALITSLSASESRANLTSNALAAAHQSGRSDLSGHANTAKALSRDVKAARTMIEMQL
ncbi:hypothetical protein [Planktotalea sp.]|uniref:hypothetical protein n=1 Tax=Planktotalea sp. TaxID=2029877 RepID=UPI003D6B16DA